MKVIRNRYGTQIQSFVADLKLPFLSDHPAADEGNKPFRGVFIRAPVVEAVNVSSSHTSSTEENGTSGKKGPVEVLGVYQRQQREPQQPVQGGEDGDKMDGVVDEDIVAVRQANVFGTSFHPELTSDMRIHVWWLGQVLDAIVAASSTNKQGEEVKLVHRSEVLN